MKTQVCINKLINNLDASKVTQPGNIPTKIIKDNKNHFSYFIYVIFNNAAINAAFSEELKNADRRPIYKNNQEIKMKIKKHFSKIIKTFKMLCALLLEQTTLKISI